MTRKELVIGTLMTASLLGFTVSAQGRDVASDTLGGAAKGAVIGAVAGDAGKGAAAGAVGGALLSPLRKVDFRVYQHSLIDFVAYQSMH